MNSKSTAFNEWWAQYERNGVIAPVQLGMRREDLRTLFGEPDATAQGFQRQPLMGIWKFGRIEFHFHTDGTLHQIYTEDENFSPLVIAKAGTA